MILYYPRLSYIIQFYDIICLASSPPDHFVAFSLYMSRGLCPIQPVRFVATTAEKKLVPCYGKCFKNTCGLARTYQKSNNNH